VASAVISSIGVMPAIGSLENWPSEYETTVDVHGTAAHASNHAGIGEWTAFQPGQNQVAARPDAVAQHADHVDLELFESIALKDRPADADHSGLDLVDGKGPGLGRQHGRNRRQKGNNNDATKDIHAGAQA
jgi:hypothetical protein